MADPISENGGGAFADQPPPAADAHGQAAILLLESLIHGLIARSVISVGDAVEVVGDAIEVREALALEPGASPATDLRSLAILESIRASLSIDLAGGNVRSLPPRR